MFSHFATHVILEVASYDLYQSNLDQVIKWELCKLGPLHVKEHFKREKALLQN